MRTLFIQWFLKKCQWWSLALKIAQGSVSETWLRQSVFITNFPYSEQPFGRAHENIIFRSLHALQVFDMEALLYSFFRTCYSQGLKGTVYQKFLRKWCLRKFYLQKSCQLHDCSVQVYFEQDIHNTDSILFGNLCDWIYILFRNWDWMFHNRRRINLQ